MPPRPNKEKSGKDSVNPPPDSPPVPPPVYVSIPSLLPRVPLPVMENELPPGRWLRDSIETFANAFGSKEFVAGLARANERFKEASRLVESIRQELNSEKSNREQYAEQLRNLQADYELLRQIAKMEFLRSRVTEQAHKALADGNALREHFDSREGCRAFVLSLDIRRSTELMLKARHPNLFANFMTDLCVELESIIKRNLGVVDKFTGDGLLAFFPEFFSGADAGFRAVLAAAEAHRAFSDLYTSHRHSFTTILMDVGMGIGMDYGDVHLMQVAGGLTVVGPAVVYACRMGSAPAGRTYMNQPAYEEVTKNYSAYCFVGETFLEIKHEGNTLAYEVRLNNRKFSPGLPDWQKEPTC